MVDLNEIERRARAEVLAACIAETQKFSIDEAVSLGCRRVVEAVEYQIRQLQPAAKALEELLREAELKAIKSSPECWHYNTETDREFMERYFAWRKNRIAKLEKARAILVKG